MKYLKNYIVLISILAVMLSSCSIDEESTTSATTSTTSVAPISDYNGTLMVLVPVLMLEHGKW